MAKQIKRPLSLAGQLPKHPSFHIYLNVKNLRRGSYTLSLVHKKKVIKQCKFKKS